MLLVVDVEIQVVLEVLKHVHVILGELVPSDSGEGEGLVIKLKGVHEDFTLEVGIFSQILVYFHSILKVLNIECSGK